MSIYRTGIYPIVFSLYFFSMLAQAQLATRCEVLNGVEHISVTNKDFDLVSSLKGLKPELCEVGANFILYEVSSISSLDAISYVTLRRVCSGRVEREHRDSSTLKGLSDIILTCKFGESRTRMCINEESDCSVYDRQKFMLTSHVRTYEIASIVNFIKTFRLKRDVKFSQKNSFKAINLSLESLKWIFESKSEPKIESIEFEDYSTQTVYSGRFHVIALQGREKWSAVVAYDGQSFSLIHVVIVNQ